MLICIDFVVVIGEKEEEMRTRDNNTTTNDGDGEKSRGLFCYFKKKTISKLVLCMDSR